MKVMCVGSTVNFKRELTNTELKEYVEVLKQAKSVVGQTGKDIFIVPSTCLPQSPRSNTGLGNWSSDDTIEFIKYMQKYLGFNAVEDLPAGQYADCNGLYCSYTGTAFALGNNQIDPKLLTTKEFEHLLTKEEVLQIAKANDTTTKDELCNFKNVMNNDGMQNKTLKKAFERFEKLDDSNQLKQRYRKYVQENNDWLFFERAGEDNHEFFKFKQFLADEHLKIGKQKLNNIGLKTYGDCLIGFSADEVRTFPEAFKKDHFIGMPEWHLPALNYSNILDDTSEASKLLKRKVQLHAKRYDAIRFDVAWAYVTPIVTPKGTNEILEENKIYLKDKLLKKIESWVKEIKGEDYNLKDLIYEFDAGPKEFSAYKDNGELIDELKGYTKVYGNTYMSNDWGYKNNYLKRTGSLDEFILGTGNHDPQPVKQIAQGIYEQVREFNPEKQEFVIEYRNHKGPAISPLARELKLDPESLQDSVNFAKAKHAEPLTAKHHFSFFMDVLGRSERFDMQGFNTTVHPEKNYAYKIPYNYRAEYHKALQDGYGLNMMDAMEKIFKANNYQKDYPELFQKIMKFNKILVEKAPLPEVIESSDTKNIIHSQPIELPKPIDLNKWSEELDNAINSIIETTSNEPEIKSNNFSKILIGAIALLGISAFILNRINNKKTTKPALDKMA